LLDVGDMVVGRLDVLLVHLSLLQDLLLKLRIFSDKSVYMLSLGLNRGLEGLLLLT
jgi:hypothetical protein